MILGVNGLALILTSGPLLTRFAYLFRVEDPPARSDAIVVLLGSVVDRPMRAADLYRRGLAPVVLLARSGPGLWGGTEVNRRVLISGGVPCDAIRTLPGGAVDSTHDEALRVRDYVRSHPVRSITVVTTAFHTARARWTFRKVLGDSGVVVRMVASDAPSFDETDWYTRGVGIRLYLVETLKTAYYRLVY